MSKNKKIEVLSTQVKIKTIDQTDFICLTDIAKSKNPEHPDDLIRNWLRNRNTLELLRIWEQLYNSDFNPVEFDGIRKQTGFNSFTLTPKQWRDENPNKKGNIRDYANVSQLVCLANLGNLSAHLIQQTLPQAERLRDY